MTKQSKVRLSVISLLLAVAVGAPVASILGNAPSHRSTAALEQRETAPSYAETPDSTGLTVLPETVITASAHRVARPAKAAVAPSGCRRVALEQQGIGLESTVLACGI